MRKISSKEDIVEENKIQNKNPNEIQNKIQNKIKNYKKIRGGRNFKIYLMLLPFSLYMLFILAFGVAKGFLGSLGYIPELNLKSITLRYYMEVFKDKGFLSSFLFTLKYSLISTSLAVILGLIIAIFLNNNKKGFRWVYSIPVITPHVAVALFTILVFSNSGIIPRGLFNLGILESKENFINLIGDSNGLGIILSYIWKSAPYVAITTLAFLEKISKNMEFISLNLGASKVQTFFYITLPQLRSTLKSSFIILFSFIFGTYELPLILGPTSPRALPVLSHIEYMKPLLENRPYAMVYNMFLIIVCVVFSTLLLRGYFNKGKEN